MDRHNLSEYDSPTFSPWHSCVCIYKDSTVLRYKDGISLAMYFRLGQGMYDCFWRLKLS